MINGTVDNVSYVQRKPLNDGTVIDAYEHEKVPKFLLNEENFLIVSRNNVPFRVKHKLFTTSSCYVQDENGFVMPALHEEVSNALSRGLDSDGFFTTKFVWIKAPTLTLVEENSQKHTTAIKINQEKQRMKKMKKIAASDLEPKSFYLLKNGNCIFFYDKFKSKSDQAIVYLYQNCRISAGSKYQNDTLSQVLKERYSGHHIYLKCFSQINETVIQKIDVIGFTLKPEFIHYYGVSKNNIYSPHSWKLISELYDDYDSIV